MLLRSQGDTDLTMDVNAEFGAVGKRREPTSAPASKHSSGKRARRRRIVTRRKFEAVAGFGNP